MHPVAPLPRLDELRQARHQDAVTCKRLSFESHSERDKLDLLLHAVE